MSLWGLELGGRGIESEGGVWSGARDVDAQTGRFFGGRDAGGRTAFGNERDVGCRHWKLGRDGDGGYWSMGGGCTEGHERLVREHNQPRKKKKSSGLPHHAGFLLCRNSK